MRLRFIDSWRTYSVFAVILSHFGYNPHIAAFLESHHVDFLAGYGQTGVFVFFFISGYVVSKTLFTELQQSSSINIGGFYIRRVFRILPPLMLYLLAYLLLGWSGCIPYSGTAFVRSAFYLSNNSLRFPSVDWYTGHTWSLSFEEQYYLVFPMLFAFVHCARRPPLVSVLFAPLILLPFLYPIDWIGRIGFVIIYTLFFAGYLAARYPDPIDSLLSKAPTTLFVVAFLLTSAPIGGFHSLSLSKFYKCVFPISIPCAVLSSGIPGNHLSVLFRFRLVSYIGKISYSIYLWQQMLAGDAFSSSAAWVQPTLLLVLMAACWASFELLEKPLVNLGRSIARLRAARANAISTSLA